MQAIAHVKQESTIPQNGTRFKRRISGWVLVVLNTLMVINAANFFLGMLRTDVVGWMMMNTCSPSIALFVIGFLLGSPVVMVASAALMFRYGTLGLFVFGWSGGNLIAQISHILMTLAVFYVIVDVVRNQRWKSLGLGVLLGFSILIPLEIVQGTWFNAHPDLMEKLFSGTLLPPGQ